MYLVISEKMLNLGLKPIETMLLAQITSFKKEGCYMSVNTLKKMFNVSYNTIVRALDTLEKKNLIKRCGYTENKTVLYVSLFKDEPTENKQESKQESKQDVTENTTDKAKEEKTENTTTKEEITLEKAIDIIENKNDYPVCKDLIIKYIIYMYEKHNKTFTVDEIEDLYNDSQILSEKELEKAINTVITKGYNVIKFDYFKQERKKNNFDNFQQRQYNRVDFYELENNFFV